MEGFHKHLNVFFLFLFISLPFTLALQVGFYSKTCPDAEKIVQQVVQQRFNADRSVPAALLRMFFHDCFIRGCDASILIDSTSSNQAEKEAGANGSVREYELIDQIKGALERACPKTVSCADIIALATRDGVKLSGGPVFNVPTGRRDGLISRASEVNLPGPDQGVEVIRTAFSNKKMSLDEMVILVGGGHSIGVANCGFLRNSIPNMETNLRNKVQGLCRSNPSASTFLDQNTSFVLDNEIYNQIKKKRGILKIDQDLGLDPSTTKTVSSLAANNNDFRQKFMNALIKMGNLQDVGSPTEIRRNCRKTNNARGVEENLWSSF